MSVTQYAHESDNGTRVIEFRERKIVVRGDVLSDPEIKIVSVDLQEMAPLDGVIIMKGEIKRSRSNILGIGTSPVVDRDYTAKRDRETV